MTEPIIPPWLRDHIVANDQRHAERVQRTYGAMNPRERRLVREAAVMGYVQGQRAGSAGDDKIPPDSAITAAAIDECLARSDLYPVMNRMSRLASRRAASKEQSNV